MRAAVIILTCATHYFSTEATILPSSSMPVNPAFVRVHVRRPDDEAVSLCENSSSRDKIRIDSN